MSLLARAFLQKKMPLQLSAEKRYDVGLAYSGFNCQVTKSIQVLACYAGKHGTSDWDAGKIIS